MAEEEWRLCRDWLLQCSVISPTSPVMTAEEPIELAYLLRDGVILCKLLNFLSPGCIGPKDITQRMDMTQKVQVRVAKIIHIEIGYYHSARDDLDMQKDVFY